MLSMGMLDSRAFATAIFKRKFASGSGEPAFAAMMISFDSLVNSWPRCASTLPFLSLMLCHLECPDIAGTSTRSVARSPRSNAVSGVRERQSHAQTDDVADRLEDDADVRSLRVSGRARVVMYPDLDDRNARPF